MKTGRRTDSDTLRRDVRDRDVSRFNRKRPSMLSEFHGKHHSYRDSEKDGSDVPHFRSHGRYSHEGSPGIPPDHSNRFMFSPSGGLHNKLKPDPRGKQRMYSPLTSHHSNYRSSYHNSSYSRNDSTPSMDGSLDDDFPSKRPRLSVDVTRRAPISMETPNSADSVASGTHITGGVGTPNNVGSPAVSPPHSTARTQGSGLSAYHLEDIDSDDDSLPDNISNQPKDEPNRPGDGHRTKAPRNEPKPEENSTKVKPSKEELLSMMEKVDRDISALETQIVNLQKKQAELEEGGKNSPCSSVRLSTPSPKTPSPDLTSELDSHMETTPTSPTPFADQQPSPKMTLIETIYADNKNKAKSAQSLLQSLTTQSSPHGIAPLYLQPSEAPCYHDNITSHKLFRPRLVEYLKKKKLAHHARELSLCERYESLMADWERKVERIENTMKRKNRDLRNRELFERTFPELKARREQQERFTRVDQRGFGVVRSDAELNEIMYELCNKEAAPARYRKTHAVIPPMVLEHKETRFYSTNGHIDDVMEVHRELKFCNIWTEDEKSTFREKFVLYPKNFEMISKFLPNKSPPDCVKFYYLSKKSENFKQLVRKANLKRKKAFIKPPDLSLSTSSLNATPLSVHPPSLLMRERPKSDLATVVGQVTEEQGKNKPEYGDWTEDNISSLKEGLRLFGRAWGKVYREVGGSKTATQCKMFYDDYCKDERLGLQEALLEHSHMKNAEKQRRKIQSKKQTSSTDSKKKTQPPSKPSPIRTHTSDLDSENTESATESDTNAEETESEGTITDSGPDDVITEVTKPAPPQTKQSRSRGSRKSNQASLTSPNKTSEDVVDLFLTAAEALKNNISPEVALHDHSYSLPPSQLVNNMDLQGTSGLSLIAAAAAVVSPNLSRNAGSGKNPVMSPVRAPRGRPPNKYRGGGTNSSNKLAPTLLSPAGSSANVLLSDIKTATFRNRTRSAPTDRPKSSTLHIPRSGSTLAKMSLSNSAGRSKNLLPPVSYSKQKSDSPSLKSMIALHPQQATGNTSAFEALVNVAVAAPPAELPKLASSTASTGPVYTARNSVAKKSSANSRSSQSTPSPVNALSKGSLSRSNSNDSNNSSTLSNGSSTATATAYIDVSQAINILASLAQHNPGSSVANSHAISVFQAQPLFAQSQAASNLLGSIVSQSASKPSTTTMANGPLGTSISVTSNPASVSATVDTLLSHLTSGVNRTTSRSSSSPKPVGRPRKVKLDPSKAVSTTISNSTPPSGEVPSTNPDDLSNLKLLSSLVAAVAVTQSDPSTTNAPMHVGMSTITSPSTEAGLVFPSTMSETLRGDSMNGASPRSWDHPHASLTHSHRPDSIPNAAHSYSNNCTPSPASNQHNSTFLTKAESLSPDELPRGVVRPNLSAFPPSTSSQRDTHLSNSIQQSSPMVLSSGGGTSTPLLNHLPPGCMAPTSTDMTASLASIIPSYNPSMGQQSTLLLYTRSRSFPLSSTAEPGLEEEDHLESATRGISELSKLLGTDGNGETDSPGLNKKSNEMHIATSFNSSSDFVSTPSSVSSTNGAPMTSLARAILSDFSTSSASDISSPPLKLNLSSLLESRGTVHHASVTHNSIGDSPSNHGDSLASDTPLNVDAQSS